MILSGSYDPLFSFKFPALKNKFFCYQSIYEIEKFVQQNVPILFYTPTLLLDVGRINGDTQYFNEA